MDNIIAQYKDLSKKLDVLEKQKNALRQQIFELMDGEKSDRIMVDGFVAERRLIVSDRIDFELVKTLLGDRISEVQRESESLRLVVA